MHMKNVYIVNSNSKFLCYVIYIMFLSHNFMQRNTVSQLMIKQNKTKQKKKETKMQ